MGGKQPRPRQRILLFLAAGLMCSFAAAGCRAVVRPAGEGPGARLDRQETQFLDQAESRLQTGDDAGALDALHQAAACCTGRYSERTLHILARVLTAPGNAAGQGSRAIRCFRRLKDSDFAAIKGPAARCWATALDEVLTNQAEIQMLRGTLAARDQRIETLQKQIDQLKAVDLEPETTKPGGKTP
jgi:hypothetical protein